MHNENVTFSSKARKWCYNVYMGMKDKMKKEIKTPSFWISVCSLGAVIVTSVINYAFTFGKMEQAIIDANQRIDDQNAFYDDRFSDINARITDVDGDIEDLSQKIQDLSHNLGIAEGKLAILPLKNDGILADSIMQMSYTVDDTVRYSRLDLTDGTIAVGMNGEEYTAEDLQDQTILMAYEENGQQVFFMGQFDESHQWDGECLINVYQDGKFVIATEALYDSGERKEYEQLFINNESWIYSKRITEETVNTGDTWKYAYTGGGEQRISFEDPDPTDMIRPSDICNSITSPLISHYCGNTSDGKYNDDSGEAYLIEYYEDGYTRLLYQGQFKDGMPNDNTENAFQIARDKMADTDYMLYKGVFAEGKQMETEKEASDWDNPLHEEKLKEYVEGKPYESELKWDMRYIAE